MDFIWRILIGAAVSALGFLVTFKSEAVRGMIGVDSDWVDFNLGVWGGMSGVIKIVGIIMIFVGFSIIVGLHQDVMRGIAGFVVPVQ